MDWIGRLVYERRRHVVTSTRAKRVFPLISNNAEHWDMKEKKKEKATTTPRHHHRANANTMENPLTTTNKHYSYCLFYISKITCEKKNSGSSPLPPPYQTKPNHWITSILSSGVVFPFFSLSLHYMESWSSKSYFLSLFLILTRKKLLDLKEHWKNRRKV